MKRPNTYLLAVGFLFLLVTACKQDTKTSKEEEKAQAIKEVLKQGLDRATIILSKENGFLTNDSLCISLPGEAGNLLDNIKKLPQGEELLTNVMSQVNQLAGSTVEKIVPVLYEAIDNMPVQDINHILQADDAAATVYLENIVREPIQKTCQPIVLESLDKKIWGDMTTKDTWETLIGNYNKLAGSGLGKLAKLEAVDVSLEEFVTEKMLDAIFYLMAKEEMNIRKHPTTRISKSLAKSLGWIGDEGDE